MLDLHAATQKYSITSGYGLFRRMTGVGPSTALPAGEEGWGGLPGQNVAVPAIVLEGTADGKNWAEIPFRYVQGDVHTAPRRTAPMQPRLDWRMWFAALGSYRECARATRSFSTSSRLTAAANRARPVAGSHGIEDHGRLPGRVGTA